MGALEIIAIVRLIIALVQMAEKHFGAGTGTKKKTVVMAGLRDSVTAKDPSAWDAVSGYIGGLVDSVAGVVYPPGGD